MTTPTTTPHLFTHEAHAYDWLKLHNGPIITVVLVGVFAAFLIKRAADRRNERRQDAWLHVADPIIAALGNCHVWEPKRTLFHPGKTCRRVAGRVVYLRLGYGTAGKDHGPAIDILPARLAARMGAPVDVQVDTVNRIVTVRLVEAAKAVEEVPANPLADRALKVAHKLLGPESQVVNFVPQLNGKVAELTLTHASIEDATPALRQSVDAHMQAKLGQRLQSQWDTRSDEVTYRAAADLPTRIEHPAPIPGPVASLPFGVDANGNTLAWNLNGTTPHMLVAGPTGGGKSNALRTIIMGATFHGIEVRACDGKQVSLLGLEHWPGVTKLAMLSPDISATILDVEAELYRRKDLLRTRRARSKDLRPLILVIDELWVVLQNLAADHAAAKVAADRDGKAALGAEPAAVLAFRSLAREGREFRIHLIVGIQRPDAEITKGETRMNFGCRLIIGDGDVQIRRMMNLEKTQITANVEGRGVTNAGGRNDKGERECQVYWSPDPGDYDEMSAADRAIIDGLRPPAAERATFHVTPAAAPEPEPIAPLLPFRPRVVEAEPEPTAPTTKRCRGECGQTRPLEDFGRDKHRPDGLNVRCRECDRAEVAARRAAKRPVSTGSGEKAP